MVNGKRTFDILRNCILKSLSKGQKTINQISTETGINWKTVENHLTYLMGRGLVREILKSEFVRIVELTEEGKEYISNGFKRSLKTRSNKIELIMKR